VAFYEYEKEIGKYRSLVNGIVVAAPLLGLLGTVSGMVETFDSLAEMALFSQTGGIAGGISEALFSTQMGLAVAIPGMIAGRMLTRRQAKITLELAQIKNMLCAEYGSPRGAAV
jgi:biopolymer transport protein ExbB